MLDRGSSPPPPAEADEPGRVASPVPGALVAGKYELCRQLAQGGMGSVWEAVHTQLGVRVAVKFMESELARNAGARERFEREAWAAAQLRSPHVVQVFDYGVDAQRPYITMELLEGEDLRSRLRALERLPLATAQRILAQACKALRLAADAGIVHRDLKPANIFLARSGDDEIVKILDFGVAKATRTSVGEGTKSGILLGSPRYMSPEQARGNRELDHRSDLWSMAVILFEMVTGVRLFAGGELGDVIIRICIDPIPKPRKFIRELPASFDDFFGKALARDPSQRFQSAREMSARFAEIVAEQLGVATATLSTDELSAPLISRNAGPADESVSVSISDDTADAPISRASGGTLAEATATLHPRERSPWRWQRAAGATILVAAGAFVWGLARGTPQAPSARSDSAAASAASAPTDTVVVAPSPPPSEPPVETATASAGAAPTGAPVVPDTAPEPRGLGHAGSGHSPRTSRPPTAPRASTVRPPPAGSVSPPPNVTATPSAHPVLGI